MLGNPPKGEGLMSVNVKPIRCLVSPAAPLDPNVWQVMPD